MLPTPLNPILKVLLVGVYDKDSDLYVLRGIPHLVRHIWRIVVNYWKGCIKIGQPVRYRGIQEYHDDIIDHLGYFIPNLDMDEGFSSCFFNKNTVEFVEPADININMMPFIASDHFSESYLPDELRWYWRNMIQPCIYTQLELTDEICYLTIQESFVEENTSQRRPGIHTETPGVVTLYSEDEEDSMLGSENVMQKGAGTSKCSTEYVRWGDGFYSHDKAHGGIYMASSVDDSCKIWNCRIVKDEAGKEIIGEHGDINHLRQFLPEGEILKKDTIYWFTDRTPHESLPLKKGTYRQFFRLVTTNVTVWFKDHSTANPKGLLPDPTITKIVSGSKFDKTEKLVIVK